ncbi:DUF1828 domain-containing protein [Mesorhizobium sp.]|uniref:DUF1828 domain-containing protein n=1 Tax=Mesorhizobium sp. TaxID=1871066 RepID=UPI000FE7457E|nr:DUF1828 domain-containing protein [Mesorhizobium sp.]RWH28310.1 MAG: DUF1828 domain-containing protein [Mesorhizobium sp.]RWH36771.1 MAG: DUF1828 domain-containing protein [Mesorhizobium sp.]TIM65454.1 MAG: DUF1828 domain-containing protein [Mesorhizobium sp.]TIR56585.1 MAG: DUF1828 domain-containing protein [Mesorhizobium sp.]
MVLKERICEAFCEGVQVSTFKGGLAVSTSYLNAAGDRIGVYALGPKNGVYKLVDNALTVAFIEAEGAPLNSGARRETLNAILAQHGAAYDDEMGEVFMDDISEADLPKAILEFSALLLRLNDMLLMTTDRVKNAFEDDVKEAIRTEMDKRHIRIVEDQPVSEDLKEIIPDMVILPNGREPVALFVATSESRLWQAMHLRLLAGYVKHTPLSVVAVLEADNSLSQKVRVLADNRLDALPRYRNGEHDTIQRIVRLVVGNEAASLH